MNKKKEFLIFIQLLPNRNSYKKTDRTILLHKRAQTLTRVVPFAEFKIKISFYYNKYCPIHLHTFISVSFPLQLFFFYKNQNLTENKKRTFLCYVSCYLTRNKRTTTKPYAVVVVTQIQLFLLQCEKDDNTYKKQLTI